MTSPSSATTTSTNNNNNNNNPSDSITVAPVASSSSSTTINKSPRSRSSSTTSSTTNLLPRLSKSSSKKKYIVNLRRDGNVIHPFSSTEELVEMSLRREEEGMGGAAAVGKVKIPLLKQKEKKGSISSIVSTVVTHFSSQQQGSYSSGRGANGDANGNDNDNDNDDFMDEDLSHAEKLIDGVVMEAWAIQDSGDANDSDSNAKQQQQSLNRKEAASATKDGASPAPAASGKNRKRGRSKTTFGRLRFAGSSSTSSITKKKPAPPPRRKMVPPLSITVQGEGSEKTHSSLGTISTIPLNGGSETPIFTPPTPADNFTTTPFSPTQAKLFASSPVSNFSSSFQYPESFAPEYRLTYRKVPPPSSQFGLGKLRSWHRSFILQLDALLKRISPCLRFSSIWIVLYLFILVLALSGIGFLLLEPNSGFFSMLSMYRDANSLQDSISTIKQMQLGAVTIAAQTRSSMMPSFSSQVWWLNPEMETEFPLNLDERGALSRSTKKFDSSQTKRQVSASSLISLHTQYASSLSNMINKKLLSSSSYFVPSYLSIFPGVQLTEVRELHLMQIRLLQFLNEISLTALIGGSVLEAGGSFYNSTDPSDSATASEGFHLFYTNHAHSLHLQKNLRGSLSQKLYTDYSAQALSTTTFDFITRSNNFLVDLASLDEYQFNSSTPSANALSSASNTQNISFITHKALASYYASNVTAFLEASHNFLEPITQQINSSSMILLLINAGEMGCIVLLFLLLCPITFGLTLFCSHCTVYPIRKRTEISHSIISKFVPRGFLQLVGVSSIVDIHLGIARREQLTVMFANINDASSIAATMNPRNLFEFLNKYLNYVGPEIRRNSGYVDKFIEAGILAIFPNQPADAVRTGIRMHRKVAVMNREHSSRKDEEFPQNISIGVGIHTGQCVIGAIGEEARIDCTNIGDSVNLSSRLQGLARRYASHILITQDTLDRCPKKEFTVRFLGKVVPKGKTVPIDLYEVLDPRLNQKKVISIQEFEQGLENMMECNFNQAKKHFDQILKRDPTDRAAFIRKAQCDEFKQRDAVWDGIITVHEK